MTSTFFLWGGQGKGVEKMFDHPYQQIKGIKENLWMAPKKHSVSTYLDTI